MSSIRIVIALVFAIASAALPAFAQDTRNVDLRFPRGTSGTTMAITTNAAFQSGNNYVVRGYFDRDGSTTFFNCWFGLDGSFAYIN